MSPPSSFSAGSPAYARTVKIKDLNKSISDGKLENVYLLHGEEEFLKESKLQKMIDVALDPSARGFNLEVRSGLNLDARMLDALLSTPPLLADRRVLVIREVSELKKNARAVLERYLTVPAPDLLLILVERGLLGKTETSLASLCAVVEFGRLEPE